MSTTSPEVAAKMAEFKNAPVRVRRIAGFGALFALLVFISFCASAFAGHVTWGRAVVAGALQFFLFWFLSFSVQDRRRWAWWVLLVLIVLRMWGALAHLMRIVRVTFEGGLAAHGREIAFDAIGVAQFIIGAILLWLLLSKEVREYVHKAGGPKELN